MTTFRLSRFAPIALAAVIFCTMAAPLQAHTPEEQLGFARQLLADGDQAFALLEHKRFLHHHRNHKDAPAAAIDTARLYIGYLNNMDRAQQELARTAAIHKNTQGAKDIKAFQDFLVANGSDGGKPLALYLAAESDNDAKRYASAITKYNQVIADYPKSPLADDAIMGLGDVYLNGMNQPAKAGEAYLSLINDHPKSPHFADANVMYVMTIEKQKGPTPEVLAAYQRIASRYPNTNASRTAAARVKAIEKATIVYKRTHNKNDVIQYKIERAVYRTRDQIEVSIELSSAASDKQVAASMEDALIQHVGKRTDKKHGITIVGFFNYPLSKAGTLTWSPNKQPVFAVKKRDTEDKLKDTLLDLFKNR